jgi:uncharacterized protein YdaL
MTARIRSLVSLTLVYAMALACSSSEEQRPAPSPPSPEVSPHPANSFPAERGDVRAAYAAARARLGATPKITPPMMMRADTVGAGTLVLYDRTGPWAFLGELYAMNVGSLVGHFGAWTAKPAQNYVAGEMAAYAAVVYVGSTFDEQLPAALLDDVGQGARPVVWIDNNIWQLAARVPSFGSAYGFEPWIFDFGPVAQVAYKGTTLTRYLPNGAGIMTHSSLTTASVLAEAVRQTDGSKIPWAVRGKNLTYIGENPMAYVTSNDRYLAFCDLLFDALAPATPERHRALVRIEDVNASMEPAALRAIADYLSSQQIPFGIATIPRYRDPRGYYNGGVPQNISLAQAPGVANAIRYMVGKGGTVILHGYTHQYDSTNNPYTGVSGDDFEFYASHIDAANYVIYDGPVAGDSQTWARGRLNSGLTELTLALLPKPTIFEFPHYAGSAADSLAVKSLFSTVYHRGLYFGGQLTGAAPDYTHPIGVMYPYVGRDVFGFTVIPENLGSYEPEASNNNPPRLVPDILATAHANRVVRDGFASFYFHPYYNLNVLKQIVAGIKAEGYTFVSATQL